MQNKPRKPWLAGLLTLFSVGLGHLYCGEIKKGIILFIGGQLIWIVFYTSFLFYAPVGPIIAIIAGISYFVYCIVDSVKGAKPYKLAYSMKKINRWYIYLLYWFVASFIIQSIVSITIKTNIAQAYKIPSGAMKPTILIGDHIITDKFTYKTSEPKRGDIVMYTSLCQDKEYHFSKEYIREREKNFKIGSIGKIINAGNPYHIVEFISNNQRKKSREWNFGTRKITSDDQGVFIKPELKIALPEKLQQELSKYSNKKTPTKIQYKIKGCKNSLQYFAYKGGIPTCNNFS